MYSPWMRCYLHPSRVTFNPKSTVMKHLCCQKRVCSPSLSPATFPHPFLYSQHCSDPVSDQLRPSCSWLLKSLSQHIEGLNTQQCLCKGSSWCQRFLWTRGRGVGPLISAAAHGQVILTTHFMPSPYTWKLHFVQTHKITASCCADKGCDYRHRVKQEEWGGQVSRLTDQVQMPCFTASLLSPRSCGTTALNFSNANL